MFLVGYEPSSKNFCLYNQNTAKVVTYRDVVFNDSVRKVIPFHNEDEGETNNVSDEQEKGESDFSPYLQHISSTPKITMKIEESTIICQLHLLVLYLLIQILIQENKKGMVCEETFYPLNVLDTNIWAVS
ncbi:unnamed protein product [Ceratitis capitata]|uniref:(Mediterranean fruit fly) hypothetical protein n=1 Tax=Ceratitis capitata TaxID=7213 RepID=A0A811UUY9_CERCA|nr:unnamed protein product [Ceratitis capitata]